MRVSSVSGRRRLLAGGAAVVVVAVVAIVLAVRGSGDGLGGVRSSDAVAAVRSRTGDTVTIELREGARRADVLAALDELPDEARWVTLHLGRVATDLDRATGTTRAALVDRTLAAAAVRAPAVSIEVSRRLGIDARVEERAQAAPLALELAERVPAAPAASLENGLRIEQIRGPVPGDSVLFLDLQSGRATEAALAAVRASQSLGARRPKVSGGRARVELRVRADSVDDAAAAWRETGAALRRAGADDGLVDLYVDRPRGEGAAAVWPVMSGKAGGDPDRALALVRRLDALGSAAFAGTDGSFARVTASGAAAARQAADAASAAGTDRFEVAWTAAKRSTAWMGSTGGFSRAQTSIDDTPEAVLRLLTGAGRARAAGIEAIHWDRTANGGVRRLRVSRPRWLADGVDLAGDASRLRRLAGDIRSIGWPGAARFDVITGPGSCSGDQAAVVSLTSTSGGRASEAEAGASCTDDAVVATVRRAWDATAAG